MKKLILLSALLLATSCSASPSTIIQKQNQIDNSYTIYHIRATKLRFKIDNKSAD